MHECIEKLQCCSNGSGKNCSKIEEKKLSKEFTSFCFSMHGKWDFYLNQSYAKAITCLIFLLKAFLSNLKN